MALDLVRTRLRFRILKLPSNPRFQWLTPTQTSSGEAGTDMREAASGLQKTSLKPVKTMDGFKRKTKQYILTLT